MFTSDLVVKRRVGSKHSYELSSPLVWQDSEHVIMVPAGFVYDGASVPKVLSSLVPRFGGRYDRATALHDWCYTHGVMERAECDKLFYKAMRSDKVRWVQAKVLYWAVRIFGAKHYKKGAFCI